MSNQIYVLDTNVLLYDADALKKFGKADIYLPIVVISELDNYKKGLSSVNQNSRRVSRFLDKLRQKGNFNEGISIGRGKGKLYILNGSFFDDKQYKTNDEKILHFAQKLQQTLPDKQVVLVTKDLNMRIMANTMNLHTIDYTNENISEKDIELFPNNEIELAEKDLNNLYSEGSILWPNTHEFFENQYLLLKYNNNIIDVLQYKQGKLVLVNMKGIYNNNYVYPKNIEQQILLHALFDDNIKILFVIGLTGTGKTLLTLGAGLRQIEMNKFKKIFITRNTIPVGKDDLGFLPGTLDEKLSPWFSFLGDALENLIEANSKELIYQNLIEVGAVGFIRGRTFKNTFMIYEECQNNFVSDIKNVISRAGENSKVVLLGDPYQIDNPLLAENDNGLVVASEKLKGQPEVGIVYLTKCERSRIAELSNYL